MKDNIKLALFFVVIFGAFTILLCTESSRWHSASIAMIFTMSGVFVGQLIQREFEIKSKNSKLSVIDKLYVNGGLLFKKAVCRDSRQGVGYKVTE